MEDRVISLETDVGLQGKTLDDLSDVIADQQRQIDELERQMKFVMSKIQGWQPDGADAPAQEVPPHY